MSAAPGRLPSFYAYAVVDTSTTPPTPVALELSRKEARRVAEDIDVLPVQTMRVRRVKVLMYES